VPQLLRDAYGAMSNDAGGDMRDVYTKDVQARLDKMHERRMQQLETFGEARWELSQRAIELIMFRRNLEGCALYHAVPGGVDRFAIEVFGGVPKFIGSVVEEFPVEHAPAAIAPVDLFADWQRADYPGLAEARPIPRDRDRPSKATFTARWEQLYERLVTTHYRRSTDDPEQLRSRVLATVVQLLPVLTRKPGTPHPTQFLATLEQLEADGAKDPLIPYCRGWMHELYQRSDAAEAAYREALEGMRRRDYAPFFQLLAHRRLVGVAEAKGDRARAASLRAEASRLARLAARMPEWRDEDRELYLTVVWPVENLPVGRGWLTEADVELLVADEEVDPWLRAVVDGIDHCQRAVVRPVDPFDGSKDAFALVEHAGKRLREAHELFPRSPLAAAMMISVCHVYRQPEPARFWFDEAVRARFDYDLAYDNFAVMLSPMAGGKLADSMHFAMECLATGRFDTDVPDKFLSVMQVLSSMSPDKARRMWASKTAQHAYERMASGYADDETRAHEYVGGRMCTLWAAGRYDEVLALWRAEGRPQLQGWCRQLFLDPDAMMADLQFLDRTNPEGESGR